MGRRITSLLEADGTSYRGSRADDELLSHLWPEANSAPRPLEALRTALQRSVYLQQDQITSFLLSDTDQDRFEAISELVGSGRVTGLQTALENSRLAWSRATNKRDVESREVEQRLERLRAQLVGLADQKTAVPVDRATWAGWWSDAASQGLSWDSTPAVDSVEAPGALDAAVAELEARSLSEARRIDEARELLVAIQSAPPEPSEDIARLRSAEANAVAELDLAREALQAAEAIAAETRRLQVEAGEQREQLRALAELALHHLDARCPVCDQTYDRAATRARLEAMIRAQPDEVAADPSTSVAAAAAQVQTLEMQTSGAARELSAAEHARRDFEAQGEQLAARLAELGIANGERATAPSLLQTAIDDASESIEAVQGLRTRCEDLALSLARSGQASRLAEVQAEAAEVERELGSTRRDVDSRRRTGELASTMIEALRSAGSDLVDDELERLAPLLQRIYATTDPHQSFRVARLVSKMRQGRGRVLSRVEDPVEQLDDDPGTVLSSSQMNVLAVSVFLTLNLGFSELPLRTAILDDPLQSLDDLNLLGFVDLLRRIRETRQLMISTHDAGFTALLERKLRPVNDSQRTVVIELQGWNRQGPAVRQREVPHETSPMRIVA